MVTTGIRLWIFLTQTIYLFFFFFFWMWTWSQAASHVAGKLPCAAFTKDKSLHVGGSQWKDAWSRSKENTRTKKKHKKSATQPATSKKQTKKKKNLNRIQAADVCRWQIGIFWSCGFLMETCADTLTISQCLPLILFLKCPSFLNNYQTTNSVMCQNLQFLWYMLW